mmetsp:Transcript_1351/g.1954  ORF Transcript_1351/g.1954 Transcript_1351/m.1954 type:complete len:484 (-) Transcript_1351:143-1594(-)|eukprot:CAMPEP_0116017890 /NCGR_PEP_ID=MMETSP0321-20121206/8328_1 /TAXON_ID=163516 /ORGANISM="Leptocylindrus danicus var. danicus, Strain B650" /LENGTH=483 /DNA_ID=CAMNT_0003488191 /DNA_START=73 /DNA_END=1524 /DNA_ORIENTATION=+
MSPQPQLPPLYCALGGENTVLQDSEIKATLHNFLASFDNIQNVLILPPDFTRFHSQAGKITQFIDEYFYNDRGTNEVKQTIMPALGTHTPMTPNQIRTMFGDKLADADSSRAEFIVHNWRTDVVTIGEVPAEMVRRATGDNLDVPWPAQLNKLIWEKTHDLILSVGQVVPHEVMGMANFNKNLFVGCGGVDAINLSHFIGAVHGMENMMGKGDNPLRDILNYASENFLEKKLPLWYILTVMGTNECTGDLEMKGFYIGNDIECYKQACELSLKVNFVLLDKPLKNVVCFLDEDEFHSTWLGNKAIYRTRMALADGGKLTVLAPGVKQFGEDEQVDILIRKYGYVGTPNIMEQMRENSELKDNLSAVAHLIHGSSEGRFDVVYCPGSLSREEIEGVGYAYSDLEPMLARYDIDKLKDGWNTLPDGEELYFISNPALGLWAARERFENDSCINPNTSVSVTQISPQESSDQSGGVGGWAKPPSAS